MTPAISVIMLTYNREKLVSRAIESVLAQTFTDFEFIIIDNGSSDRSGAISDEYSCKDSRIKVIHRKRGGISSGRNAGLDLACGGWIAFIDDDDWIEPDFLEFLYSMATENGADVSICGTDRKSFDEKLIMGAQESLIRLMWRDRYNAGFPTKLFRRELIRDLRFPEDVVFDDIALMYRLLALASRVVYHGLPKYTAYRHESNNSAWTTNHELLTPQTLDEYLIAYRLRTEWLLEKFPASASAWKYFEWSFMISMVEKINRLGLKGCGRQLEYMTKELEKNKNEFLWNDLTADFEKEWIEKYMNKEMTLGKFTLIITTRCNLKCRFCCEYVPENKPFPDMDLEDEKAILKAIFSVFERVNMLHLSGGGEPFLHPKLAEMVEIAMEHSEKFDRLMLFTNSTVPIKQNLLDVLEKYKDKLVVQLSQYGINPERENEIAKMLDTAGINCKIEKYYGNDQSFGGWVDFGPFNAFERTAEQLSDIFQTCAVTRVMHGNWRTRNGKVHWCSRSQRGMELGLIPDNSDDYVDLFDDTSIEEKHKKFRCIENSKSLLACDYCSGEPGTLDQTKRFAAAEQKE